MKTIAILTPAAGTPLATVAAVLPREEPVLWQLMMRDACRGIWYDTARPGQVVLELEAPDAKQALHMLAELPLVAERIMQVRLLPLQPYSGLALLFRHELGFAPEPPATWGTRA